MSYFALQAGKERRPLDEQTIPEEVRKERIDVDGEHH